MDCVSILFQICLVDGKIFVVEHIENDLDRATGSLFIISNRSNSDFRCFKLRKAEYACGNTAESNAFTIVFICEFQAGGIAGGKKIAVLLGQSAVYDGSHGV